MPSPHRALAALSCVAHLTACGADGPSSKPALDDGGADRTVRLEAGRSDAAVDALADHAHPGAPAREDGSPDGGPGDAAPALPVDAGDAAVSGPPWLSNAAIVVQGNGRTSTDCRSALCQHQEDTDLIQWSGAIWLIHRTAQSHVLGPNSSLHVYRSGDGAKTFTETAILPAPTDRDIRAPHFFVVGSELRVQALTRLPVTSTRDLNVDTVSVVSRSVDGAAWSALAPIGPPGRSFWRIKEQGGTWYTAAYADGDSSVTLYSSGDGSTFTAGADLYSVAADTPVEAELSFLPSGRLLALVRLDGTDPELLGATGRLRTKLCSASPPYASFSCATELDGERLDGPVSFFAQGRLFVVAREHLRPGERKRTALYEVTGDPDGGAQTLRAWGDLPSAGDTSYAGVAPLDATHVALSWYSGDLTKDEAWTRSMLGPTDVWTGVVDVSKLR